MDKSKQSTLFSNFSESSDDSYSNAWMSFKSMVERIRNDEITSLVFSPSRWFSWKGALGITILGLVAVCVHRSILWFFPDWIPRMRLLSPFKSRQLSSVDFYNKATQLLGKLGIHRARSQTQREFFLEATAKLQSQSVAFDGDLIARLFYARRFGSLAQLPASDQSLVDSCLASLEADLIKHKKSKTSILAE